MKPTIRFFLWSIRFDLVETLPIPLNCLAISVVAQNKIENLVAFDDLFPWICTFDYTPHIYPSVEFDNCGTKHVYNWSNSVSLHGRQSMESHRIVSIQLNNYCKGISLDCNSSLAQTLLIIVNLVDAFFPMWPNFWCQIYFRQIVRNSTNE